MTATIAGSESGAIRGHRPTLQFWSDGPHLTAKISFEVDLKLLEVVGR